MSIGLSAEKTSKRVLLAAVLKMAAACNAGYYCIFQKLQLFVEYAQDCHNIAMIKQSADAMLTCLRRPCMV